MKFRKKLLIWVFIGALLYLILGHHFVFVGNNLKLLRKSSFNLNYTFFSTQAKSNESIMAIDELREAGIGDLLVEAGRLSEDEKERLIAKWEAEPY